MKKILFIIISPVLILLFLVGVVIYAINKKAAVLEFVFDTTEYLIGVF